MMTRSADTGQEGTAADASADMRRLAAEMLDNPSGMAMHPFMTNPAAAMAAATAIGFSLSSQMAGAFFGALQGAVAASRQFSAAVEERGSRAEPAVEISEAAIAAAPETQAPAQPEPARVAKAKVAARANTRVKTPAVEAGAAALPDRQPSAVKRKAAGGNDDLKRISGIGPKLAQVLNERGICRFADIAGWGEADIGRIDAELAFDGRIMRDDWVGQAKALMEKPAGR